MDQDKMQHLKSPFFPPLKVGSKIGEDVFLANIISYSSKSINNFIAILLTFIWKSFHKSNDKVFKVGFKFSIR